MGRDRPADVPNSKRFQQVKKALEAILGKSGAGIMSLREPRCMVCGAPLGQGAPFEKEVRDSEVCSDKCYDIYMDNEEGRD